MLKFALSTLLQAFASGVFEPLTRLQGGLQWNPTRAKALWPNYQTAKNLSLLDEKGVDIRKRIVKIR